MRRPIRTSFALACAVIASVVALAAPQPEPTQAVTNSIWLDRVPNGQRLAGAALAGDGATGFVASTHSFGNTQGAKVWRSIDGGTSWYISGNIPAGSWESVAVSGDGQTVVALGTKAGASAKSVMVSADRGESWADRTPAGSDITQDVDITSDATHIALATDTGIKISNDNGANWVDSYSTYTFPSDSEPTQLSLSRLTIGKQASDLVIHVVHGQTQVISWLGASASSAVDLSAYGTLTDLAASDDGSVVLAGSAGSSSPPEGAYLHISRDSGATWSRSLQASQTNSYVSVAVSGDGARRIAAGYGNPILESTGTGGSTWTEVDGAGNNPWMSLAMSSTGSHLLGGTERSSGASVRIRIPTPGPTVFTLTYDGVQSGERLFVPATGGGQLEINGGNFYDVTSVSIGGVNVAGFVHEDLGLITLEMPPAASLGRTPIVVTTAHGTATLDDVIDYYPLVAPSVTSTSVATGSFLGGTKVTFTGEGLREVTEVLVDREVAEILYQSPTVLEIRTPATRVGLVDISFTNPTGNTVLTDGWTSTWEAYATEPVWSSIDGSDSTPIDSGGYPPHVSRVVPDGNGGSYIVGRFEDLDDQPAADHVAQWNGSEWSSLGEDANGRGLIDSLASSGPFGQRGIETAVIDNSAQLWVGGSFEFDGEVANIARFNPVTETWWVPSDTPDDRVTSIVPVGNDVIVAGDFGPLPGVPSSSRVARLSPAGAGTWTGVGSDGSGGPSIAGNGTLYGAEVKSIQAAHTGPNESLIVAGAFRLSSTTTGQDLIAQFDGTSWSPVLQSAGDEIVTSLDRGAIEGVDTIVAGVCSFRAGDGNYDRGRVLTIVSGVVTTVGTFDDCVRDVTVVGDGIVAVGWFTQRVVRNGTARAERIALLHDGKWTNLEADIRLESVTVLDNHHLAVSSSQYDDRIASQDGTEYMARIGSLRGLVTNVGPLTIGGVTSTRDGESLAVTVTGTGFTESTDVTLEGRPADNLVIVSDTVLTFTAAVSTGDRTIRVYGRSTTATATLSPPVDAPPTTSTTTTPATSPPAELPTSNQINTFPVVNMLPKDTPFYPGASFNVTTGGFVAGEEVWFLVASTPRRLGSGIVSSDGTITAKVTLPTDLVGNHTLVVWSPTTGRGVRQPITIAASAPSAKIRVGISKTVPNLLASLQIPTTKRSKFTVSVRTTKLCAVTPKKAIRGLKKGDCRLAVKIIPPKGKASTKIITVTITPRNQRAATPPDRRRN